ncbi:hypothetical protein U879_02630 [Defluviimonas sp. 20V17]|uniref:Assimilatory nitrate reductase catalytic subunit n=1 Tax=Allgaiera indica TaxID=765699 RepID=A0AAN4UUE0_9RHOB|nr:hypothetical protein [Allgaiera indica]KDB05247.1 hypothetical protein U879_02630 [Defluviimonas sp. 20V17]GHE04986.1 hypothetical protein GCM10008024_34240 [Allgaiera indica]SDX60708.1 assimilatory nitrate reductase catalytic subunit [Allgaiera indica]
MAAHRRCAASWVAALDLIAARFGQAAAARTDLSVTGLRRAALREFFDMWIGCERVVTVYSQGVNRLPSGTDKVNAILNCHLATGRIGRPAISPSSRM